jgi:hypothetical protein
LDREYIDVHDFVMIFSAMITQARHDIQNEEAMQYTTIKQYETTLIAKKNTAVLDQNFGKQESFSRQQTSQRSFASFSEQEIVEILAKTRKGD